MVDGYVERVSFCWLLCLLLLGLCVLLVGVCLLFCDFVAVCCIRYRGLVSD